MATTEFRVSAAAVMRRVTLHVRMTGQRRLRVRMWLAVQLLRLAAWTVGCGLVIDAAASGRAGEATAAPAQAEAAADDCPS